TGAGFNTESSILVSPGSGGLPIHIENVHVVSGTSMTFSATAPPDQTGVARVMVQNEAPTSTSSVVDLIVDPNVKQTAEAYSTFNVGDYFASGSATVYHCSGSTGKYVITCDGAPLDFRPHEGIRIVGAGPAEANAPVVEQPSITDLGRKNFGNHTYCYM